MLWQRRVCLLTSGACRSIMSMMHFCRLEHSNTHSRRECGSEFFAALQIVWADDFRGQDRFWRLRLRADNQRISNGLEPPPGRIAQADVLRCDRRFRRRSARRKDAR